MSGTLTSILDQPIFEAGHNFFFLVYFLRDSIFFSYLGNIVFNFILNIKETQNKITVRRAIFFIHNEYY